MISRSSVEFEYRAMTDTTWVLLSEPQLLPSLRIESIIW